MEFLMTLFAELGNIIPFGLQPLDFGQIDWQPYDWESIFDWVTPDAVSGEVKNTGGAINDFVIQLCNRDLMKYAMAMCNDFTGVARYLGAIFAIIVAARQAYKIMAEGDRFEILDVMRPILFAFVLSCWPAICSTLLYPGKQVETYFREQYYQTANLMEERRDVRSQKAGQVTELIATRWVSADKASEKLKDGDVVGAAWSFVTEGIRTVAMTFTTFVLHLVEKLFIAIGEIALAVCVYIVFLTKVLYITVLVMFGPIHMVCSILEVWKTQWSQWVGKIISVSMYGAMAYLVLTFSMLLITYSLNADIVKLDAMILNPDNGVANYIKGGFGTTIMTATAYIVGAVAMSQVYELATLVFPSQALHSASHFIGGMKSQAVQKTGSAQVFGKG